MKILLRDVKTARYLQLPGVWTSEIEAATDFGDSQRAIDFAQQHRITGAHVVIAFVNRSSIDTIALGIEPMACIHPALTGVSARISR